MKKKRISLRLALPLGLALLLILVLGLSFQMSLNNRKQLLYNQAKLDILSNAADLARTAEQSWQTGQSLVESNLAQIAADPRVNQVFVLDNKAVVLAAQHYAWRKQPVQTVMPGFDLPKAMLVINQRLPHFETNAEKTQLQVMQPFDLPTPATQIGVQHRGLIYIRMDISRSEHELLGEILYSRLPEALGVLFAALVTGILLHRLITQPLRTIVQATDKVAYGDLDVAVSEQGPVEIAALANRFNSMVASIQAAQERLTASEQQLSITLHSIGDAIIATDTAARITLMNPVAENLTGWPITEALGRPIQDIFIIENALTGKRVDFPVRQVLQEGVVLGLANHTILLSRTGKAYHISDSAAPIRDNTDAIKGMVLVFQDMTESYRLREALAESEQHFRTLTNSGQALIWTANTTRQLDYFNDPWIRFTGLALSSDQHFTWDQVLHPDDLSAYLQAYNEAFERQHPVTIEHRLCGRDGDYRWMLTQASPRYDSHGDFIGLVGHSLDITLSKQSEAELERLAYHDALTGLPNRILLVDRLNQTLASTRRNKRFGALMFVDLDRFKQINDVYGHALGDSVIKEVAHRLTGYLRQEDTVARLGGDEFVVLLPNLAGTLEDAGLAALNIAEKIRQGLEQPMHLHDTDYITSASIGITLFPKNQENADDLMREADIAMYQAKEMGRNTLAHFEAAMQDAVRERYTLEQEIQEALRKEEFRIYVQSQVDANRQVLGAEILLRWNHPHKGFISPATFIPIAEESGLIIPLGEWVLRKTCELRARLDKLGSPIRLAVNVSPRQFHESNFVERIRDILQQTGANPALLTLEITENLLIDHASDIVPRMMELTEQLGLQFSIDDFGTGYSSLAYLKRLPLTELKIDKSFVQDIATDPNDAALVEAILAMAKLLNFEIVAEGVEQEEQFSFLRERDCQRFQGYYFHLPIPAESWLDKLGSTETETPQ